MKYKLLWTLGVAIFAFSCTKTVPTPEEKNENETALKLLDRNSPIVARLSYGDSIIFKQGSNTNYTVLPVSAPAGAGYYRAIPAGLSIDSLTGRINPALSESGVRYKVYKIFNSGVRADSCRIIISGIDYEDGIYELASTPNNYDTAFPVYNALPTNLMPCSEDDDDEDDGCTFDETDIDGDGNDDLPGVIQDKLMVNTKTGTLDLEASFHAGLFGSSNPGNGIKKDLTMYYRLNDASNRALHKIDLRIYHFNKRTDIPDSLIKFLNKRKNYTNNSVNARAVGSQTSLTADVSYTLEARPKRPPVIIICSQ
jgi:hypothetical protein